MEEFIRSNLPWSEVPNKILHMKVDIDPLWLNPDRIKGLTDIDIYKFLVLSSKELPEHFIDHYLEIDDPNCQLHMELLSKGIRYVEKKFNVLYLKWFIRFNSIKEFKILQEEIVESESFSTDSVKRHIVYQIQQVDSFNYKGNDFDEALEAYLNNYKDNGMILHALARIVDDLPISQQIKIKNKIVSSRAKYHMIRANSMWDDLHGTWIIDYVKENWDDVFFNYETAGKILDFYPETREYIILSYLNYSIFEAFSYLFQEDISKEVVTIVEKLIFR